jgi:hypothetical protein
MSKTTEEIMFSKITLKRFFLKFQKSEFCWNWEGNKNYAGYGLLGNKYAHRMAWQISNNKLIPKNMVICHHCDNPSCVNPDHLFIGTQKENVQDMIKKNRQVKKDNAGQKNPMFGKKHSEQSKKKMSETKKGKFVGSNHPRATINEETVKKIKQMRLDGFTSKKISNELNISFHVVRNVIYGKSWK